ncbi:flagellar biosynthetic protein FliO [Oligoflexia bacterium]|nr:flagellar biosynthetic protein FliO [Oligoflexia bacterium]
MKNIIVATSIVTLMLIGSVPCLAAEADVAVSTTDPAVSPKMEKTKLLLTQRQEEEATKQQSAGLESWRSDTSQPQFKGSGFRMLQGLAICVGVFLVGVYFIKRFGKQKNYYPDKHLNILERMPLTQKTALLLVEVNGENVLLSVGSDRVNFLKTQDAVAKVESKEQVKDKFDKSLDVICKEELKLSA